MRSPFVLPNSKDPLRLDWGDEASHSCVAFSIVIFPMFVFTTEWDADFGIVDFGTLRISESGRFSFGSGRPWRPSSTAPRWIRKPARPSRWSRGTRSGPSAATSRSKLKGSGAARDRTKRTIPIRVRSQFFQNSGMFVEKLKKFRKISTFSRMVAKFR